MRSLLIILLLAQPIFSAMAANLPLTAKEIGLMLRSGYSSEAVLRELSTRHFAGDLDSVAEQQLARAGANQSLITALQSGAYAAPSSQIAAAQEALAAQERQRALAARQSGKPKTSPPASVAAPHPPDAIYRLLEHDLVSLQRGEVKPFDDKSIAEKKLYLFFFAANTSPLARKFTPVLVEYYNRVAPLHPEFETIFLSKDRSLFGMETYMRETNMPWPAVVFDKVGNKLPVKTTPADLPVVILVNGSGNVLYSSTGSQNADPNKVTVALDEILAASSADPPASPPRSP